MLKEMDFTNIVFVRHGESFNNTLYDVIRNRLGPSATDHDIEAEEVYMPLLLGI